MRCKFGFMQQLMRLSLRNNFSPIRKNCICKLYELSKFIAKIADDCSKHGRSFEYDSNAAEASKNSNIFE